jgi:transcriptional regulator with XRE-family HTH domain
LALKIPGIDGRLRELWDAKQRSDPEITQEKFARAAGVSQQLFSKWMKGQMPDLDNIKRLAEAFGVTWPWLLIGDEGIKSAGALSRREPVIIRDARMFHIATYNETVAGVSLYEVDAKKKKFKTAGTAAIQARQMKEEQKL